MRKVELQILAKDIRETNYLIPSDCAITRALKRAGLTKYEDVGTTIAHQELTEDNKIQYVNVDKEEYRALSHKVQQMYKLGGDIEPEDFTHTLTFLDLKE